MATSSTIDTITDVSTQAVVKINGIDYTANAQSGMVITDTLSEELDSATLILTNVEKTAFEPFTDCMITTRSGETFYFYVNTYMEELFDYENKTYQYTLSLISQTKILERVLLPNLKVRKTISSNEKTLYLYSFKVMRYINQQFSDIEISDTLMNLMQSAYMPEIEWNHPNAKQVLNDMLMTIPGNPCLIRLANKKLYAVSLAQKNKDIESYKGIKIINPNDYEQMSDYANNITMDTSNIIPKSKSQIMAIVPKTTENLVETNNVKLILPKRIESLSRVIVVAIADGYVKDATGSSSKVYENKEIEVDITPFVIENSEYNIKNSGRYSSNNTGTTPTDYKFLFLHFQSGSNAIEGMYDTDNIPSVPNYGDKKIDCIISYVFQNRPDLILFDTGSLKVTWSNRPKAVYDLTYKVEYISQEDIRIKAVKTTPETKDCSIYQTQNQSAIDLKSFMKTQREAVNRLGNEVKKISMICRLDAIPKLGDYYQEDYILSQREIAYYYDFAIVNGTFTKDYVQKNTYYGLSSRKRYTQLAQASEAVIREEHRRKRVLFYLSDKGIDTSNPYLGVLEQEIAKFFNGTSKPVKIVGIETNTMTSEASLYPSVFTADRSVFISCQCEDNYSIGMKTELDSESDRLIENYVKYVNSNGEFSNVQVKIYNSLISDYDSLDNCKAYPDIKLGSTTGAIFGEAITDFDKDNGETLKITYQFDFVSGDEEIIIGDGIGEQNSMSLTGDISTCSLYYSTTAGTKVDKKYPVITSGYTKLEGTPMISVSSNMITFDDIGVITGVKSYALVNSSGEVIIAVNKAENKSTIDTSLYINVKGEQD